MKKFVVLLLVFFCFSVEAVKSKRDRITGVQEKHHKYAGLESGKAFKKKLKKKFRAALDDNQASDEQLLFDATENMMVNGISERAIIPNWCTIIALKGAMQHRAWNNLGVEYMLKVESAPTEMKKKSYMIFGKICFKMAMRQDDDKLLLSVAGLNLARLLEKEGSIRHACSILHKLCQTHPEMNQLILYTLGIFYENHGLLDEAISAYSQILSWEADDEVRAQAAWRYVHIYCDNHCLPQM